MGRGPHRQKSVIWGKLLGVKKFYLRIMVLSGPTTLARFLLDQTSSRYQKLPF